MMLLLLAAPSVALAGPTHRVGSKPPLPPGATAVGPLGGSTQLSVTVTLQPRDPAALAAYAQEVSTPGSSVYHRYLSVAQFAKSFGPTDPQVSAARQALRAQGLDPGPLSANHLSFSLTASSARLARALNTNFARYRLRDGRTAYANTNAPRLSGSGASIVQAVLGLNNLALEKPVGLARSLRSASTGRLAPRVTSSSPLTDCPGADAASTAYNSYTASQIAGAYGLDGLYSAGDLGSGATVALYELEPFQKQDIDQYQACYGTSAVVTPVKVGVGAGSGPGSGEAALDIEDVIGLAPQANILVYEGPNYGAGPYATYAQIISDDSAKVISTSWGVCEGQIGSDADAENTLFEEAATQGQSIFAASGDNGAQDCTNMSNMPVGGAAVDDPASQPYVTGVGGTSLLSAGPPPSEIVWNEGTSGGSGGGGVSTLWPMPSYQTGFARSQSSVRCGSGGGSCREVPDVAASADEYHGYDIYYGGQWTAYGGTSAAAPTWASLIALADASPACTSAPVGFANPGLYAAARTGYSLNFNDVTSGSNSFDGVPGFSAEIGYDMASGLGSPKGVTLAATLCGLVGDLVRFNSPPSSQTSTAGRAITPLTISATSVKGATPVTYSASGLPAGLSIASLGRVTGTPTRPGFYTVTLSAVDHDGMIATHSFTWIVNAPAVALKPLSRKTTRVKASVRIVLHATDMVGARLTFTARNLPRGLRINHRTGVISGKPTRKGKRKVTVRAADAYGGSAQRQFTIVVRSRR